jgi:hypothetical protein
MVEFWFQTRRKKAHIFVREILSFGAGGKEESHVGVRAARAELKFINLDFCTEIFFSHGPFCLSVNQKFELFMSPSSGRYGSFLIH